MAKVGTLYFVLLSVFVALAVVNFALRNDPPVNYFWLQLEKQLLSAFGRCAALKTSRFPSSSPHNQNRLLSLWSFALYFLSESTCCRWLGHHRCPYQKNQYCQNHLRRFLHHFHWIYFSWNIAHKSQAYSYHWRNRNNSPQQFHVD